MFAYSLGMIAAMVYVPDLFCNHKHHLHAHHVNPCNTCNNIVAHAGLHQRL
jgi:hypothetical protein